MTKKGCPEQPPLGSDKKTELTIDDQDEEDCGGGGNGDDESRICLKGVYISSVSLQ